MTFLETVQAEFNRMRARAFATDPNNASDDDPPYSAVTHAGLAVIARDSGLVLLCQRADDPTDDDAVRGTWEFPGGGLNPGENPLDGAVREYGEEVGIPLPEGLVVAGWRAQGSGDDVYQGFVYVVQTAFDHDDFTPTEEVQAVQWVMPADASSLDTRPEMADFDWSILDINKYVQMIDPDNDGDIDIDGMDTDAGDDTGSGDSDGDDDNDDYGQEPDINDSAELPGMDDGEPVLRPIHLVGGPIPIHGVIAPEAVESGDGRGFTAGAMTSRPLRLPFSWQKVSAEGHGGSVVIGSIDRLMRGPDGLIHWEGLMMTTEEANEFCGLLNFFGQYGVSVDGDQGSIDSTQSDATGVLWFDGVRCSGVTAVAIPAFHEAYVAYGPHPDMPAPESDESATLTASGKIVGARGPGWVTDPKATNRIHAYWTEKGQKGYDEVGWGKPGDFDRAKALIGEKIGANSPDKMKYLNQIIAQWHHDALGYWPATHAKMVRDGVKAGLGVSGNRTSWENVLTSSAALCYRTIPTEKRKQMAKDGTALPDGSFPIENVEDLKNAIQSIGRAKDPAKAKAHIRKRAAALGQSDLIPDTWAVLSVVFSMTPLAADDPIRGEAYCCAGCGNEAQWVVSTDDPMVAGLYCNEHAPEYEDKAIPNFSAPDGIEMDEDGGGWEAVLTSSMGSRALPPSSYFDRHPDTGALVIEDPDEFGLRRTYGYAGEWGVCHIGIDGRCVEVPEDDGDFEDFHLGRTKTADSGYLNTGLITYKVDHRDAKRVLTESAEKQHFDNIAHAWAAVRLGQDENGIWFSGVVLPNIPEEDLVLIEAAGQVSGEWKYGALRALQAVNVPGFPVLRSSAAYDDEGNVVALVAATYGATSECAPSPAEMMAALAAADAEVRFAAMRAEWNREGAA